MDIPTVPAPDMTYVRTSIAYCRMMRSYAGAVTPEVRAEQWAIAEQQVRQRGTNMTDIENIRSDHEDRKTDPFEPAQPNPEPPAPLKRGQSVKIIILGDEWFGKVGVIRQLRGKGKGGYAQAGVEIDGKAANRRYFNFDDLEPVGTAAEPPVEDGYTKPLRIIPTIYPNPGAEAIAAGLGRDLIEQSRELGETQRELDAYQQANHEQALTIQRLQNELAELRKHRDELKAAQEVRYNGYKAAGKWEAKSFGWLSDRMADMDAEIEKHLNDGWTIQHMWTWQELPERMCITFVRSNVLPAAPDSGSDTSDNRPVNIIDMPDADAPDGGQPGALAQASTDAFRKALGNGGVVRRVGS